MTDEAMDPRLVDAMVESRKKSPARAYVLWFFLGALGAHNFYLGKPVLGALQFVGSVPYLLWSTVGRGNGALALVAFVPTVLVLLSLLVDAFLIPARVRAYSDRLRASIEADADWRAA